jgi:hypothetical protein
MLLVTPVVFHSALAHLRLVPPALCRLTSAAAALAPAATSPYTQAAQPLRLARAAMSLSARARASMVALLSCAPVLVPILAVTSVCLLAVYALLQVIPSALLAVLSPFLRDRAQVAAVSRSLALPVLPSLLLMPALGSLAPCR